MVETGCDGSNLADVTQPAERVSRAAERRRQAAERARVRAALVARAKEGVAGRPPDLRLEKTLFRRGVQRLAAMDEVGRGALAGPVTVGVVVVTAGIGRIPKGLRDSKLLTPAAREALVPPIRRWVGEYAVGHASSQEIDLVGILGGLRLAAARALATLAAVDAVLLDGNHNYLADACDVPVHTRIKGDLTCAGVSAASVLAKTERDALMVAMATEHPEYDLATNKGYATPDHMDALRTHGPSRSHRLSWRLPGCGSTDPGLFELSDDAAMDEQDIEAFDQWSVDPLADTDEADEIDADTLGAAGPHGFQHSPQPPTGWSDGELSPTMFDGMHRAFS